MEIITLAHNGILRKAWLLALLSSFLCAYPQTDTVRTLNELEVVMRLPAQGVMMAADGSMCVATAGLHSGIHSLGVADALRAVSMLPGYSTGSDYGSGLSIDGCDFQHNAFTIDGARVFFPYHFGGIFSDFNTSHIASVRIAGTDAYVPPLSLGSVVQVSTPNALADDFHLSADVGILSSSISAKVPVDSRCSAFASARTSYIDAIYGDMLKLDDAYARYGFSDFNLTALAAVDSVNSLKINGFMSRDRVRLDDPMLDTRLRWSNYAASASFAHSGTDVVHKHHLSFSSLSSHLNFYMPQMHLYMPSSVSQFALDGYFYVKHRFAEAAYRVEQSYFHPQRAYTDGSLSTESKCNSLSSTLVSTYISRRFIRRDFTFKPAVSVSGYFCDGCCHIDVNPSLSFIKANDHDTWTASLSSSTQYMHQVGFSDIGLASNFWLPSTSVLLPQQSLGADVHYARDLSMDMSLLIKGFARWVWNCPEYYGNVLGVLTDDYDPFDAVSTCEGFNVGGDVLVNFVYGPLSGWGGYSLSVCRRHFPDSPHCWLPSALEPLHSFKMLASWRAARGIDLSAYFALASGRPYTPVTAVFMVGGNVLTEYGARNSARLPLYHRLDLSATWHLPPLRVGGRSVESSLNLSVINAYGHKNIEMQYFTYDDKNHSIYLRRISSLYRFMPSLSYSVAF